MAAKPFAEWWLIYSAADHDTVDVRSVHVGTLRPTVHLLLMPTPGGGAALVVAYAQPRGGGNGGVLELQRP